MLTFSHCKASWSYDGFHIFRTRLAKAIGIDLESMNGFGGPLPWPEDEPLVLILNHPDHDGSLTPEECGKLIPRLEDVTAHWDNEDFDKMNVSSLISGMRKAVYRYESMEFR